MPPRPTLTPGIEPCSFITYRGRTYQHDLQHPSSDAEVGRWLGTARGTGCGAYSPRGVKVFASRDESAVDVVIVIDNFAPHRYVLQPPDLCTKDALRISLGRRGIYHGRSSLIVLIRNVSKDRCTLSSDIELTASGAKRRIRLSPVPPPRRTPLLPGQALNVLVGSGSGTCTEKPQFAALLDVRVGLVTEAYLRHSLVQINCGTPEVFEIFAEPLN